MTFEQVVAARAEFQAANSIEGDAQQAILDFLEWEEPDEDQFAQAVRIVLVAADFSKELTTAVMWLNSLALDIRCVRLKPYVLDGRVLMDVQQVIPLPEAAEYQVQVKEKSQEERKARKSGADFTRYDVAIGGEVHQDQWKRRAALLVATALVKHGTSPEEIDDLLMRWRSTVWWKVQGNLSSSGFEQQAKLATKLDGRVFDTRRWFLGEHELIRCNGSTYAFTNQWGVTWPRAIKEMAEMRPELQITVTPTKV